MGGRKPSTSYSWILGSVGQGIVPAYNISTGQRILTKPKFSDKVVDPLKITGEFALRDVYFKQSTQAYNKGDKHLAQLLSKKGQKHQQVANALIIQAAQQAFWTNNKKRDLTTEIDLHGLFVHEAISVLAALLSSPNGSKHFRVITGAGHNSPRAEPKINKAVIDFCKSKGFLYDINPFNRGIVIVTIPWRPTANS